MRTSGLILCTKVTFSTQSCVRASGCASWGTEISVLAPEVDSLASSSDASFNFASARRLRLASATSSSCSLACSACSLAFSSACSTCSLAFAERAEAPPRFDSRSLLFPSELPFAPYSFGYWLANDKRTWSYFQSGLSDRSVAKFSETFVTTAPNVSRRLFWEFFNLWPSGARDELWRSPARVP